VAEPRTIIRLVDDDVRAEFEGTVLWSLPIKRLTVIGEYTNADGPWVDDYYFAFVPEALDWCEVSFYSDERDDALKVLGERLGHPLECGLQASANLASRVMWPASLLGRPLFDFRPTPRQGLKRVLDPVLPLVTRSLTDEVCAYIREECARRRGHGQYR
jgi:hypothetical protein